MSQSAPSESDHTAYRIFRWVYWIGIPVAFLVMLSYAPPPSAVGSVFPFTLNVNGAQAGWLLFLSYSHVLVLSGVGFYVRSNAPPSRYVHAGVTVQTAGYLHTLIGFGAALFLLNPDSLDVLAVLGPIGSALGTSILGWFLGGEIVGRTEEDLVGDAEDRLSTLLEQIGTFTETATERHRAYLKAIKDSAMAQRRINDAQEDALQAAVNVGETFNKDLETVEASLSSVADAVGGLQSRVEALDEALASTLASDEFRTHLEALARAAERTHSSLTEAATSSDELDTTLESAATHAGNAREALKTFANGTASEHEAYTNTVRKARSSLQEIVKMFQEILDRTADSAKVLNEAPTNLDPVAESVKELQGMLRNLADEIQEVTGAVRGVGESGRQTKTAIEETGVSARRMTKAVRQTRSVINDMIDEALRNDLAERADGERDRSRNNKT